MKSTDRKRWGVPGGPDLLDLVPDLLDQFVGGWYGPYGQGLRGTVLLLLAEAPHTGAALIEEIGRRGPGPARPAADEVYPLLQQLADEGLVTSDTQDGPRTYTLTEKGREAVPEGDFDRARRAAPGTRAMEAHRLMGEVVMAAGRLAWSGDERKMERAAEVLTEARRKLYALLAED
ncbi:PadR family transcriptional regulator [Streptomyces sp. NBC_01591]|uniref:PadR family transcriptional regulator n=1 Tax=Streptomyces sp. NBC_01591 TaxID=2975888 RepID=UPI002DD89AA5|nr:PadR family transcriptional regulator [Streptomyces sp. NBC_01591]WSD70626.1 PadR family transcriptional regulator [Streptomyces sp. NBC_01591]